MIKACLPMKLSAISTLVILGGLVIIHKPEASSFLAAYETERLKLFTSAHFKIGGEVHPCGTPLR